MKTILVTAGQKFHRWQVISELPLRRKGHRLFRCQCDCGTEKIVSLQSIRTGQSKSCGCLREELAIKHGRHKTSEYTIWAHMIQRCENPKNPRWRDYGGRGIKICQRWRKSFESFLADMGERPSSNHSIDRLNNDGDYKKSNCKWSDRKEQRNNQRGTVWKRIMLLLAGQEAETVISMVNDGKSDELVARHIARVYRGES